MRLLSCITNNGDAETRRRGDAEIERKGERAKERRARLFLPSKISPSPHLFFSLSLLASLLLCVFALKTFSQKIAIITPEKTVNSEKIAFQFAENFNAMDSSLVEMAVKSQPFENIFNLSTAEAKTLGNAIGCDFFIILKTENLSFTSRSNRLTILG